MTGLKKNLSFLSEQKKLCIEPQHGELSIIQQCSLLDMSRSSYYYETQEVDERTLMLMKMIDEEYMRHPFYGTRKMTAYFNRQGININRKRIQNLYRKMGIEAIYQKPNLSKPNTQNKIYPYLLRGVTISHCNHVWSTDITYIRMKHGFVYLMAIIDWYSRYVLDWELSTSLDAEFCVEALKRTFENGACEIFNTDQGCQFTSNDFISVLNNNHVKISMDGKGRALDNIFVERLWRSTKYECIYLKDFYTVKDVRHALLKYFKFYNNERPHQSLDYRTPAEIYC